MSLDIRYNGIKPQERCYRFSIQNNAENDKIFFILQGDISNILSLQELSLCDVYLKCESAGKEYLDKIKVEGFYVENTNTFTIPFIMPLKTTQFRNLNIQIQFQDANSNLIAQTEIVGLELSGTIKADEEISDKYPSELVRMENELTQQGEELANHEQRIETLEQQTPYMEKEIVVSDDVDSFENENGVDKLIRELESDGTVEKTFLIDKIYHESTLVECEQHREANDYIYCAIEGQISEVDTFINDLGVDTFYEIFGENCDIYFETAGNVATLCSLYYNVNNETTKGFLFTSEDGYVGCTFYGETPNQEIKIVVGKYFEYDEHGNKVFDDKTPNFFCEQVVGNEGNSDNPITEEQQTFIVKTDENGYLYFDNDGGEGGNKGFILYSISIGEPAHTEYKKREIGKGGGGGSAVSNVEIKKIYLTYKDRMSIRADYLGIIADDGKGDEINFVNDSTRIYYNFETTIIDDKIEEEINNGRFVIRLDYPLKNRSHIFGADETNAHNSTTRNGVGARGFKYKFNGVNDSLIKTLIFIEPKDIKVNRYGEKYIHKQITLVDYIKKICDFGNRELEPITLDWINNDDDGINFFENYLDEHFSCGIPHISQTGDEITNDTRTIYKGSAKTNFSLIINTIYFYQSQTSRGFTNSAKLNPAFSCYSVFKLYGSRSPTLNSKYYVGKHKSKSFDYSGWNGYVIQQRGDMGKHISHNAYMVARPRCAIVNDDFATSDYAFLKTYPQADQQIRLYCKYILDVENFFPIFRTFITQK